MQNTLVLITDAPHYSLAIMVLCARRVHHLWTMVSSGTMFGTFGMSKPVQVYDHRNRINAMGNVGSEYSSLALCTSGEAMNGQE